MAPFRSLSPLALAVAVALALTGCAPRAVPPPDPGPRATASTRPDEPASFHPLETGLHWQYLLPGDPLTADPILVEAVGPTTAASSPFPGGTAYRLRTRGRGIETTRYFVRGERGLLLVREDRPGVQLHYQQPLVMLPPKGRISVGVEWGGATRVRVVFEDAPPAQAEQFIDVQYHHHVLDRRTVELPAGAFDAYIIGTEATEPGPDGVTVRTLNYERWFVPYVGEIRTAEGHLLADRNFR
jgi:hypothetical protein